MNILILCAGKGTRISSLTNGSSKVLLQIGGFSLLERILQQIQVLSDVENIFINVSYDAHNIVDTIQSRFKDKRLTFLYEKEPIGPSQTIASLLLWEKVDLMVIHGDLLLATKELQAFQRSCMRSKYSKMALHKRLSRQSHQEITLGKDGLITKLNVKTSSKLASEESKADANKTVLVDSGLYFFRIAHFDLFIELNSSEGVSSVIIPILIENSVLNSYLWLQPRFAIDTENKLREAIEVFETDPSVFDW